MQENTFIGNLTNPKDIFMVIYLLGSDSWCNLPDMKKHNFLYELAAKLFPFVLVD